MSIAMVPALDRSRLDWEAAIRATVSTVVPLVTLYSMGRLDLDSAAAFGAFTALFGRGERYRDRIVTLLVAGGLVFASIVGGALVHEAGLPLVPLALGFVAIVSCGVLLTSVLDWIPRGALFFVFAYLGTAMRPDGGVDVREHALVAAASVGFSLVIGLSGWLLRRIGIVARRLRPIERRPERSLRAAFSWANLAVIAVTVVAGAISMTAALGLNVATHHYWAVITVVAIFAGPAALVSFDRISHRVVGTLVGVGLAAALFGGSPHPLYVIGAIAACSFATELVVGQHYGMALAFLTPLAIGATNLGTLAGWEVLFVDRARETLIGGAVCFAFVLVLRWWWHGRSSTDADGVKD